MKRGIVYTILIFIVFIIQSTVIHGIRLGGIVPNLLLILVVSFGFFRGQTTGLLLGFFVGLLNDLFLGDILGFYALVYMCIGFFCGFANKEFYDYSLKLPLVLIIGADLIYNMVVYWFLFMMRSRLHFTFYLRRIIIPELIYTVAVGVVLYSILYVINDKLTLDEKRRDSYFV